MLLVTGSTGNVGAEVVHALCRRRSPVRALIRHAPPANVPSEVEVAHGDLDDPATLAGPLSGVDGVFLLPGYPDMAAILAEIRRAGARRVVLLSGSSAEQGDESNAVTAYMVGSERAVRESGLSWTIVRSFGFMSNALRWLPELAEGDVVSEPFADVPIAVVDPYDIAAVAAEALLTGDHAGQTYLLSGPDLLLPSDRVRIVSEETGRPLRFKGQSNQEAYAQMSTQMPPEYVDAMFSFYVDNTLDESRVLPTIEQLLGRPPRTFRDWAIAHADKFRR